MRSRARARPVFARTCACVWILAAVSRESSIRLGTRLLTGQNPVRFLPPTIYVNLERSKLINLVNLHESTNENRSSVLFREAGSSMMESEGRLLE